MIKRKPGFSGKMFWSPEIPFKTGFTVLVPNLGLFTELECSKCGNIIHYIGSDQKKHYLLNVRILNFIATVCLTIGVGILIV